MEVFKTKSFQNSDRLVLHAILGMDRLDCINELNVFKAAMIWAENNCIKIIWKIQLTIKKLHWEMNLT